MSLLSKILIIDTATKYIYLSLVIDNIEKQYFYQEGINNHSVTIIPMLGELLKREHIMLNELNKVIIGIGPGSYTGVRIGVTVAKMIGYLNNIEVSTISSLAIMASASNEEYVLPYIDARRGNAFMALFKSSNGVLERVEDDCLENVESFKEKQTIQYDFITKGKPNVFKLLESNLLTKVDNIHELKPNYLQITEAERNKG